MVLRNDRSGEHASRLKKLLEPWAASQVGGGLQSIILRFFPKDGFYKVKRPDAEDYDSHEEEVSVNYSNYK